MNDGMRIEIRQWLLNPNDKKKKTRNICLNNFVSIQIMACNNARLIIKNIKE